MNAHTQSSSLLAFEKLRSGVLSRRSVLPEPCRTQAGFAPWTLIHKKFTAAPPKQNRTLGPATLWLRVLVPRRLLRRNEHWNQVLSQQGRSRKAPQFLLLRPPPRYPGLGLRRGHRTWPLNSCADSCWILAGCLWIPGGLQGDTPRRRSVSAVLQRTPM